MILPKGKADKPFVFSYSHTSIAVCQIHKKEIEKRDNHR